MSTNVNLNRQTLNKLVPSAQIMRWAYSYDVGKCILTCCRSVLRFEEDWGSICKMKTNSNHWQLICSDIDPNKTVFMKSKPKIDQMVLINFIKFMYIGSVIDICQYVKYGWLDNRYTLTMVHHQLQKAIPAMIDLWQKTKYKNHVHQIH